MPSLMERTSMPEFGWLAAQILSMEDALDQECGLWPALQQQLLANPSVSVETALKVSVCVMCLLACTEIDQHFQSHSSLEMAFVQPAWMDRKKNLGIFQ